MAATMYTRMFAHLLLVVALAIPASLQGSDSSSLDQEIATWHAQRIERLTSPDGWLTLIGRHWLKVGAQSVGSAKDNDIVLAAGPDHLGIVTLDEKSGVVRIALAPGSGAKIDGRELAEAELQSDGAHHPTLVSAGSVSLQHIERSGRHALRVKDSQASSRIQFLGIERFATDPSWRIEATWVAFEKPQTLAVNSVIGTSSNEKFPGKAVFEKDGQTYELWPIEEEPEGPLFFVFADLTNGKETYEASRFLYAERAKNGRIILDFNKAYNPPCAFTSFATCPLPPRQNRLKLRVTAGELKYRGHD